MACDDCARRDLEDNVDGLGYDVEELTRVKRNQGIVLVGLTIVVFIALHRLNAKGVLTWGELLEATADG